MIFCIDECFVWWNDCKHTYLKKTNNNCSPSDRSANRMNVRRLGRAVVFDKKGNWELCRSCARMVSHRIESRCYTNKWALSLLAGTKFRPAWCCWHCFCWIFFFDIFYEKATKLTNIIRANGNFTNSKQIKITFGTGGRSCEAYTITTFLFFFTSSWSIYISFCYTIICSANASLISTQVNRISSKLIHQPFSNIGNQSILELFLNMAKVLACIDLNAKSTQLLYE